MRKNNKINTVIAAAVIGTSLLILIAFFLRSSYTGVFQFQLVKNLKTGGYASVAVSCFYYLFIGVLAYMLLLCFLFVVVVEPLFAVYAITKKVETKRGDIPDAFSFGFTVSAISSAVIVVLIGTSLVFGIAKFI